MRLVISGGTLGLDRERTRAVVGRSSSFSCASLAVNGECAVEAAERALAQNLSLAFQFNMTTGRPVCLEESTLVHNGYFLGRAAVFKRLTSLDEGHYRDVKSAIKRELLGQMRMFYALTGLRAFWLDGVDYIHVIPVISDVIKELFSNPYFQFHLIGLCCPHDITLSNDTCPWIHGHEGFASDADCYGFSFWLRVSHLASRLQVSCQAHAIPTRLCVGLDLSASDCTTFRIARKLLQFQQSDMEDDYVVEWVVSVGCGAAATESIVGHHAAGFPLRNDPAFNSFLAENQITFLSSSSSLLSFRKCNL